MTLSWLHLLRRWSLLYSRGGSISQLGALYLGTLLLFIIWGLIQASLKPDKLMLSFMVYQVVALVFGASILGYTRLYLSEALTPVFVDRLTSFLGLLVVFLAILYTHFLLEHITSARWRMIVGSSLMAGMLMLMLMQLAGEVSLSLRANMFFLLFAPVIWLALGVLSPTRGRQAAEAASGFSWRAIMVYLAFTLFLTILTATPALGLVQGAEASMYMALFCGMWSGLLMLAMLQYRAHFLIKRHATLASEARLEVERAEKERQERLEREQLLHMLGQELNTPLATLRLLLTDEQVPVPLSRKLDASVIEMTQVLERTVQTNQVENGVLTVNLEYCLPEMVLKTVCESMPGAERIKQRTRGSTGVAPPIQTDRYLLGMILRNLLDNALKYSAAGSTVLLEHTLPDPQGEWYVVVSNHPGRAGWPDADRLFQKYYRSPKASHRSGTGLGLYMVQGLAKLLGATLSYEPCEEWIRFKLTLRAQRKETQR